MGIWGLLLQKNQPEQPFIGLMAGQRRFIFTNHPPDMTKILISNDDGIHAPGILALIEVARAFGELTIVAPDSPQSGMGHAISIGNPLRVEKEEMPYGLTGYACSGTPADCVKVATGIIMEEAPDLILSGINHGSNSSVSSIYSGTLSAAREGAIQGIPSIGFSYCAYSHDEDMTLPMEVCRHVIEMALELPLGPSKMLNVNIPKVRSGNIRGYKITRQAYGRWVEEFDQRVDPYGRKYYWLTGKFELQDEGEDTDEYALAHQYVSITPMGFDFTDYPSFAELAGWENQLPGLIER